MYDSINRFSKRVLIIFAIIQFLSFRQSAAQTNYPVGFVNLGEVVPTIVLDMRYYSFHNFIGEPIKSYHANKCILTSEAADALGDVQKELVQFSLSLKIYDCYRPQDAVDQFIRWAQDLSDTRTKNEFYPTIKKQELIGKGYISGQSSHSRGSTVDITIVPLPVPEQAEYRVEEPLQECYLPEEERFKDNSIDMGSGYDCFHRFAITNNSEVGARQRMNRLLLKAVMEKHGFVNYEKEWWHFTLKNEPFKNVYFNFSIE